MSGLEPLAPLALISFGLNAAESVAATSQRAAARRAQQADNAAAVSAQTAEVAKTREIEERRRREQLRRAAATQRTRSAAAGVAGPGGSARALLQGLISEQARRAAETASLDDLRFQELSRRLAARNRRNLLAARRDQLGLAFDLSGRALRLPSLLEDLERAQRADGG